MAYQGYDSYRPMDMLDVEPLGRLLWARSAPESAAARFLTNIAEDGRHYGIGVSGHDPVSEGFDKAEKNQLVLSTSYRMQNADKHYLVADLASSY